MGIDPEQFKEILHTDLPYKPWMSPATNRLPGIQPVGSPQWIERDDMFNLQIGYRDWLVTHHKDRVINYGHANIAVMDELYQTILTGLDDTYQIKQNSIIRPDGFDVPTNTHPMDCLARLIQEDLLILEKHQDGYILSGGILCFPASWTLSEKVGKPLDRIHQPVRSYDSSMAKRVDRLFTGIRVGHPLWRANYLLYETADLHQPRREAEQKPTLNPGFVRVEKQTLFRLPETQAVIFGIHSYVARLDSLTGDEKRQLMSNIALKE